MEKFFAFHHNMEKKVGVGKRKKRMQATRLILLTGNAENMENGK